MFLDSPTDVDLMTLATVIIGIIAVLPVLSIYRQRRQTAFLRAISRNEENWSLIESYPGISEVRPVKLYVPVRYQPDDGLWPSEVKIDVLQPVDVKLEIRLYLDELILSGSTSRRYRKSSTPLIRVRYGSRVTILE